MQVDSLTNQRICSLNAARITAPPANWPQTSPARLLFLHSKLLGVNVLERSGVLQPVMPILNHKKDSRALEVRTQSGSVCRNEIQVLMQCLNRNHGIQNLSRYPTMLNRLLWMNCSQAFTLNKSQS